MPGNLALASPSGVLPFSLCTAFSESRHFPILVNSYHDGTTERAIVQDGVNAPRSIRIWRMTKRLTASQAAALKSFLESKAGGKAFYFYNPAEPATGQPYGSNFDATGASVQGRHAVFFRGAWNETTDKARSNSALELVETY